MGKKKEPQTFGSAVATGEIPSVTVGAETATAVFVETVEEESELVFVEPAGEEGGLSPEDSGDGEGEGALPLGSDTADGGDGAPEGGEPPEPDNHLPTEEELKEAFELTPGLAKRVVKVLADMAEQGFGDEETHAGVGGGVSSATELSPHPVAAQIDRKFRFVATSRQSHSAYDESNAVVFLARDPAFPYALDGYLTGCIALGADIYQIEAVKALKERVMEFQEENATKLPDVEAGEERDRMMAKF